MQPFNMAVRGRFGFQPPFGGPGLPRGSFNRILISRPRRQFRTVAGREISFSHVCEMYDFPKEIFLRSDRLVHIVIVVCMRRCISNPIRELFSWKSRVVFFRIFFSVDVVCAHFSNRFVI